MPTTGAALRAERKRINTALARRGLTDITVAAIARAMGVSRQTVHGIEAAGHPAENRVAEYREALYAIRDAKLAPSPGSEAA